MPRKMRALTETRRAVLLALDHEEWRTLEQIVKATGKSYGRVENILLDDLTTVVTFQRRNVSVQGPMGARGSNSLPHYRLNEAGEMLASEARRTR